MTDLTTPAASSIALPVSAAPPSVNAPNPAHERAFCRVMYDKQFKKVDATAADDEKGQDDAATGKDLPEKDKSVDPALAWLFGAPTVLAPIPAPVPPPVAAGVAAATADTASTAEAGVPTTSGAPEAKPEATDAQGKCEVVFNKPGIFKLPVATPTDQPDTAPQPIKLPLVPPRLPTDRGADPASPVVALPALFALSMATERTKGEDDPLASLTQGINPLSQATTAMPVAPTGDAQRQALDMGRQDWPQKMIDHIEALRDNANANDTSIRLKPEALGRVDIALKTHNDGAISVRFTAEQPTTRTLLVDATPQLSAAADARGIRLSGTSVDLNGQGDQRQQPQTAPAQPITNRLATPRGDDNQAVDDGRIA